mmetsp:Transcript_11788/g.29776  ORF Transcript_11788/g.29776 Transcript_11788/m.29776 type:complete len:376 (-) Transcript_11788:186-1313(-)
MPPHRSRPSNSTQSPSDANTRRRRSNPPAIRAVRRRPRAASTPVRQACPLPRSPSTWCRCRRRVAARRRVRARRVHARVRARVLRLRPPPRRLALRARDAAALASASTVHTHFCRAPPAAVPAPRMRLLLHPIPCRAPLRRWHSVLASHRRLAMRVVGSHLPTRRVTSPRTLWLRRRLSARFRCAPPTCSPSRLPSSSSKPWRSSKTWPNRSQTGQCSSKTWSSRRQTGQSSSPMTRSPMPWTNLRCVLRLHPPLLTRKQSSPRLVHRPRPSIRPLPSSTSPPSLRAPRRRSSVVQRWTATRRPLHALRPLLPSRSSNRRRSRRCPPNRHRRPNSLLLLVHLRPRLRSTVQPRRSQRPPPMRSPPRARHLCPWSR